MPHLVANFLRGASGHHQPHHHPHLQLLPHGRRKPSTSTPPAAGTTSPKATATATTAAVVNVDAASRRTSGALAPSPRIGNSSANASSAPSISASAENSDDDADDHDEGVHEHPSHHNHHPYRHDPPRRSSSYQPSDSHPYHDHHHQHHPLHQHHSHRHGVRMPDLVDALKKRHRLSLPSFVRSSSRDRKERKRPKSVLAAAAAPPPPVALDWKIESPPLVFHGCPEQSSGALLSGLLRVEVSRDDVSIERLDASLTLRVTHKWPCQNHCADCETQILHLANWRFFPQTVTFKKGLHQYPFSHLLQGDLPASMDNPLLSISYQFHAEAVDVRGPSPSPVPHPQSSASLSSSSSEDVSGSAPSTGAYVSLRRSLLVKRSITDALFPHNSIRIFPPTNIKACADYSPIVRPIGSNKLTLKLHGLVTPTGRDDSLDLYRLKKLTWRLEEITRVVAPACAKHAHAGMKLPCDDDPRRGGHIRNDKRIIGDKEFFGGWKADYAGADGTIEFDFDFCLNRYAGADSHQLLYACDTRTKTGIDVTHRLHIELIVSKEFVPRGGKLDHASQTGTGRVLRMQFSVVLTEYPGMGVSWDNEAPPVYQDVPPSPPRYDPPVEYDELLALDPRIPTADDNSNGDTRIPTTDEDAATATATAEAEVGTTMPPPAADAPPMSWSRPPRSRSSWQRGPPGDAAR